VVVFYQKAQVTDAPRVARDNHLSREEEQQLYRHYGLDYGNGGRQDVGDIGGGRDRDRDRVYDDVPAGAVGRDTSGPTTDDAMTRSEDSCAWAPRPASPAGRGCASTWLPNSSR
jgi:hypothetical protein